MTRRELIERLDELFPAGYGSPEIMKMVDQYVDTACEERFLSGFDQAIYLALDHLRGVDRKSFDDGLKKIGYQV